jgi:hypothetical protein
VAFTNVGANLSSTTDSMTAAMIALALLAFIIGPALLLLAGRGRGALAGLPRPRRPSISLRRGGGPPST